ncbi:DUF421 domain-containing protein [Sediminibacillus dalangtanensis]|uniref:DUF421 domain-containing protein n=1 Tax=Sediminibacillus dalangtanensis TaxID=2729421 RepID=A0ABX7VVA5_9BACI|nr:DUF421 domain-containing protein [Sediminibacillus dalangtanensis]QTN00897.1 DUF421 domain-containing protein [Sediminibacillus dalangtanensis]
MEKIIYLSIAVKLVVGLIGIVIVTRFLGKKEMSQVTPLDFVYALILGGIIEDGLYEQQTSLGQMMFALFIWGAIVYLIESSTQKFDNWRNVIKGKPTILIEKGKINIKQLKKAKLEIEQLRTLLRMEGIFSLKEVAYAVLENSGTVSVLQKAGEKPLAKQDYLQDFQKSDITFLLVEEGDINDSTLNDIGKSEEWLRQQLRKEGYELEQVYYGEWSRTDGFVIQSYDE